MLHVICYVEVDVDVDVEFYGDDADGDYDDDPPGPSGSWEAAAQPGPRSCGWRCCPGRWSSTWQKILILKSIKDKKHQATTQAHQLKTKNKLVELDRVGSKQNWGLLFTVQKGGGLFIIYLHVF